MDFPDDAQPEKYELPVDPWLQPGQDSWAGGGGRENVPWEGDGDVCWSDQDWARWFSKPWTLTQPNTQSSPTGWNARGRGSPAAPYRQNTPLRGQAMPFTPFAP
eukprot:90771-Pyramimonas_sp.AAC.1